MKTDRNRVRTTLMHSLAARKTRVVLLSVVAFAVATLFVLVTCSARQNQSGQSTNQQPVATDWKPVVDVFGFPGDVLPEGVIRFNMPRKDLHVTIGGTEIKPALALGAWAAFRYVGQNDAMVMGDLVLTEEEVAPVMKALQDGGVRSQLSTTI